MPTIVGLRRRGYTPRSLQLFSERIGVSKADSWIDYTLLEQSLRDDLDPIAPRAVAVLEALRLIITNLPAGQREACLAPVHPHRPELGTRTLELTRELWIEANDFTEQPPPGYFRLYPGNLVRLRYAYVIRCTGVEKDAGGRITAVLAEYLPDTRSGTEGANRVKVKGAIHWLPADACLSAEVRLFEHLFTDDQPDAGGRDFRDSLNPASRRVLTAFIEPGLATAEPEDRFQFERQGYFVAPPGFQPHRHAARLAIEMTSATVTRARIAALRAAMQRHGLHAWIVPSSDPHLSEYLPPRWQGRQWLSGFTGSVGTLVVTPRFAGLWVDSRYWLQADAELAGSDIVTMKINANAGVAFIDWLAQNCARGDQVGVDGRVLGLSAVRMLQDALAGCGASLRLDLDLLEEVWPERPGLPVEAIFEQQAQFAPVARASKLKMLRDSMQRAGAGWHLICTLDDIAWLLNLRGCDVPYKPRCSYRRARWPRRCRPSWPPTACSWRATRSWTRSSDGCRRAACCWSTRGA